MGYYRKWRPSKSAAFLGAGGWIIDPPEYEYYVEGSETPTEWCEDNYDGEWRLV